MLPRSLDSESLQRIAIGVLVGLGILCLLIAHFVRKMMMRVVLLALTIGLGVAVWAERVELQDCARTCDCRLLGRDVHVPGPACAAVAGN